MKIGLNYNKLFEKKEFYTISYSSLDEIVNAFFGVSDYDFVADEEASNYSSREYNIKKEPLSEYDQKKYEDFIAKGCGQYITSILLQVLVNEDAIPEGNILVEVSW